MVRESERILPDSEGWWVRGGGERVGGRELGKEERQTQTVGRTDGRTDRQTDRQIDKQTESGGRTYEALCPAGILCLGLIKDRILSSRALTGCSCAPVRFHAVTRGREERRAELTRTEESAWMELEPRS
jgi:hypothetical protein